MDRGFAIVLTIITGATFSLVEACGSSEGGRPDPVPNVGAVSAPGAGVGGGAPGSTTSGSGTSNTGATNNTGGNSGTSGSSGG